jgi:hypothetical protein
MRGLRGEFLMSRMSKNIAEATLDVDFPIHRRYIIIIPANLLERASSKKYPVVRSTAVDYIRTCSTKFSTRVRLNLVPIHVHVHPHRGTGLLSIRTWAIHFYQ